ncbi:MAG: nucleoside-diphosphate kinase [Candidatus Pacebacteria bacterium]|nr:nucleoside-diphosphate kinase [Candidatus Paceibacterota bacterium]
MFKKLKEERTLVMVKPDGVKRGLVGEIVKRIEQRGLKLIALEMFQATKEDIEKHYSTSEENLKNMGGKLVSTCEKYNIDMIKEFGTSDPVKLGALVHSWLGEYLTSGPMVKMVVQGILAVEMVRKLAGNTMPAQAEMGTIRGDFSVDSGIIANTQRRAVRNVVHASGNVAEAEFEIGLWFKSDEIHSYKRAEEEIMF